MIRKINIIAVEKPVDLSQVIRAYREKLVREFGTVDEKKEGRA